ncbi:unnamed protein product, partial [Porites evermanni]
QVRGRSTSLTCPFFTVAQNSECWLCVWILNVLSSGIWLEAASLSDSSLSDMVPVLINL